MAIIKSGVYAPGHKPEPSLHEKLKDLRMTSYPGMGKDCRPLPIAKEGGCFSSPEEKADADRKWKETYQKTGA